MIELTNVEKSYHMGDNVVYALRGVNVTIDAGDFVAIMGPSGSGKSTLMHVMGLLDVPDSGSYKLAGREVSHLNEDELAVVRRNIIGFVFQQFHLLPRLTALQNTTLPHFYAPENASLINADELLQKVGLGQRSHHRPNELSGGQQQRVAIARALVNNPRVIMADEPTGNLDSASEREIMELLKALNRLGITIIIVTHEEEIGRQARRLIRMRDGVIQSDERLDVAPEPMKTPFPEATLETGEMQQAFSVSGLLENFQQAIRTLAANKARTALSMLGILIGVAAVVAMLALGSGASKAIESQLASLGSNLLTLRPGGTRVGGVAQETGTMKLTPDDGRLLKDRIPGIKQTANVVNGRVQVTYGNRNWNTQLQGVTPAYATMHASNPEYGRFFTEEENLQRQRIVVIGRTLVTELFGGQNPLGEFIKVNKISFQVIGVLPEKGASGFRNQDDVMLVPINTAMRRVLGKEYVDYIEMEIDRPERMESVQDEILDLMYRSHNVPVSQQQGAYEIRNLADIQAAMSQSSKTMSVLLASIAAISLLVGGIGIMNIMLVSVTERTREIGLRKAIGARRKDISAQFLTESVVVSGIGGLLGIALGWGATLTLSLVAGWTTSISPPAVALAFFFSAGIGIIFGIYPARKAAQLNPIDALRHE